MGPTEAPGPETTVSASEYPTTPEEMSAFLVAKRVGARTGTEVDEAMARMRRPHLATTVDDLRKAAASTPTPDFLGEAEAALRREGVRPAPRPQPRRRSLLDGILPPKSRSR